MQFNPDFCFDRYKEMKTVESALMANLVTLREIGQAYNESTPALLIKTWLILLSEFMGFEVTPSQANETARYIYEEAFMFNIAELTLFFKQLKKGVYGEFYGKFNGQKILIAAREYRQRRGEIFCRLSESEQKRLM